MATKADRYEGIDGLKAYAIIGIALMHVLANGEYGIGGFVFERLIPSFTNLVFLFMMVSGFGMCCGYYQKIIDQKISVEDFYKKRYIKIWPYFALLCALDFVISPSKESLFEIFANLTLCQGLLPNAKISVIGVSWTLAVIFVFYMLFPFFCFLIGNKKRAWGVAVTALVFNWLCGVYFFDGNHIAMGLVQLLFTVAIMVVNQKFFISGFKSLWHKAPNMDTLVALGSMAAFTYSTYALFAMTDAQVFGVGPHTISVPRICPADDISTQDFPDAISDDIFCKIVAVIRIAVPYTGMIISTRESAATRRKVLNLGISQISGGSRTSVGGYAIPETPEENSAQFDISDTRTLDEVVNWLLDLGHIPSFCTACYRAGRTGDRFMSLVKSGQIANCCAPNALMTLKEYLEDYAAPDTRAKGIQLIKKELEHIPNPKIKEIAIRNLKEIEEGKRDFRF